MKTGFIHGYPNKPVKKRYSYHGLNRDCLIQPEPDPFEEEPILPPYGPEQEMKCYTTLRIGWYQRATTYLGARNAASGYRNAHRVGQTYSAYTGKYTIYRWGAVYVTDNIPVVAYITSVVMYLIIGDPAPLESFYLVIQSGDPIYPHEPSPLTDYAKTNYSGEYGKKHTDPSDRGRIPFNQSGIDMINRFGKTKYAVLSSRDIDAVPPRVTGGLIEINPIWDYTYLLVKYKMPL